MTRFSLLLLGLVGACGQVESAPDAAQIDAPAIDAPACQPRQLLVGGQAPEPQGWSIVMSGPATLSQGPDYTRIVTTTASGQSSGGQLLLTYPGVIEPATPFALSFVVLVEAVATHNYLDAAAAIMASYSGGFGDGTDRAEMLYLDAAGVGWADDTGAVAFDVRNNAYHTYRVDSDGAGTVRVSIDGMMVLTRPGFITNGAIAIGDQTNDAQLDATLRIRSIAQLCP